MDLLQKEIRRKRKAQEALQREQEGGAEGVKFVRQGDIAQQKVKALQEAQVKIDQEREEREAREFREKMERDQVLAKKAAAAAAVVAEKEREASEKRKQEKEKQKAEESDSEESEEESEEFKMARKERKAEREANKIKPRADGVLVATTFSKGDDSREKVIRKYFKLLVEQWGIDLEMRSEGEKNSAAGKKDDRNQLQCFDHISPLLKLCKKGGLPDDIAKFLYDMVCSCENGNFRGAHEVYMKAAIVNAAWPIGVTQVGIHERSAREKLSEGKVAHVMNDEQKRKYFTAARRLMTYAQDKFPDLAPSLKMG